MRDPRALSGGDGLHISPQQRAVSPFVCKAAAPWCIGQRNGHQHPAETGLGAWQHFRFAWTPRPGRYALSVRATDAEGRTQPETPVWNPGGYSWNGIDEVTVEVRG